MFTTLNWLIAFALFSTKTLCDPEIPDIFNILKSSGIKTYGYKIVWEINDITGINSTTGAKIGTSYSVTEYYDIQNKRGKLDIKRANGVNGTFIYFEQTKETFHLNQGTCTLGNIYEKPDFLKKFLDDFWQIYYPLDQQILGPSALLRLIKLVSQTENSEGGAVVRFMENIKDAKDFRYFNGNLWNFNIMNEVMGWVFTDPSSPNPYGYQNMAIPVWVTVNKNGVTQKRYEVANFVPYTNTTSELNNIQIPLGLGCGRNLSAIADAPLPPQLDTDFSYDMRLEVVMQPSWIRTGNDVNPSNLVDNGRLTYDDTAKLMAWRYDGFNNSGSLTKNQYYDQQYNQYETGGFYYDDVTIDTSDNTITADDGTLKGNLTLTLPTRTVWDMNAGIVYIIDDIYGNCIIKQKKANDFLVSINFKSGYKIPVNTPELIRSDGFLYMGEFVERGIPVLVYEKRIDKMLVGYMNKDMVQRTVVFTHYFVKDNYKEAYIGNDMLLRIGISVLYPNRLNNAYTQVWSATINVNEFTLNLNSLDIWSHVKQQVFNVKSCYLKPGLSKWFQLGFPITTMDYYKMYEQADNIDRQILRYLFTDNDLAISPTRIPTSLIGWSSNTLYFSALMLERAPFSIDFRVISIGQQKLKNSYSEALVKNFQDCSGRCLDSIDFTCNYFSICDNFMCILNGDPLTINPEMVHSINCTTYQRSTDNSMLTMNMLLSKIESRVQVSPNDIPGFSFPPISLTLFLFNSDRGAKELEMVNLTAVQFKTGFNFGQINTLKEQIALNNNRYTLKSVTHYKLPIDDKRFTLVQANGFLNCQQKCDDFNNNTCHSFSYCTTNNECILSTMHSLQLFNSNNSNTYVEKSDCALLYRDYISEYDRFSVAGITIPKTATKQILTKNAEECALACSTEKSFKCRSFDKCDYSNGPDLKYNCFLHTTHILENVKNESIMLNLDPQYINCGHYSRNYASDFNVKSNMRYTDLDGQNRIEMIGLTVEQCAHRCVESESKLKCVGFSYCQGKLLNNKTKPQPVCVLSPTDTENNNVYYTNDEKCELYFNGNPNLQPKPTAVEKSSGKNSSGRYSSGAGAGVGILMLLLGAFIGIVGVIAYQKRKARNSV